MITLTVGNIVGFYVGYLFGGFTLAVWREWRRLNRRVAVIRPGESLDQYQQRLAAL